MDGKSHKDRLEQFFDQKWDDEKLSQEMATPDLEDAWDGIQNGLQDKRRSPWWLLLLLLPVAFGVGTLYYVSSSRGNSYPTSQSNGSVSLFENSSNKSSENAMSDIDKDGSGESSSRSSHSMDQSSSSTVNGSETASDRIPRSEVADLRVERRASRKTAADGMSEENSIVNQSSSEEPLMAPGDSESNVRTNSMSSLTQLGRKSISPLDFLVSGIPLLTLENDPLILPSSVDKLSDSRSGLWNMEIFMGYGWHLFMTGDNKAKIEQVEARLENGQYWTAGIGAALEYRKNRSLELSFGWREHTFTSHYELGVNYTGSGEIQDGQGNWHQGYKHTLPTLFGDTPMEHVLIRGENDGLNEGEFIPFGLFLEHRLEELNFSVGHSWKWPVGTWQVTLGADLQGAYWYDKEEIRALDLVSRHEKVYHNRTEYVVSTPDLVRPWYLGIGAMAGIEKNIFANQNVGVRGQLLHPLVAPVLHHDIKYAPQFLDVSIYWKSRF